MRGEPELSSSVEGVGSFAATATVAGKAFTSLLLFFSGSGPSAGATERGGAAMGSVVEEEELVPLAPLVRASSNNALLLSFPEVVSTSRVKRRVK